MKKEHEKGCHGCDDLTLHGKSKKKWNYRKEYGGWRKNVNAGGSRNYIQTFATNPQFSVEITKPDIGEEHGMLIVGLMQKDDRRKRAETGADLFSVGYMIYEV